MQENHIFPFLWMRGEEESVIHEEMGRIAECGIKAVCVEARPHDDFCKEGWWRDLGIVIQEAKKRGMKIWILDDKHFPTGYANGWIAEKYPERKKTYIASSKADLYGGSRLVTLDINRMLKPSIGYWEIGKPADYEERSRNQVLSILAVKCAEGMELHEETIDLTESYNGTSATFRIPAGAWRVHVIYKTKTDGGDDTYINLIDRTSAHTQIEAVYEPHYAHFSEEFGKTIAGFFSDEPQLGNISEMCYDTRLGKKKMQIPWSDELQEMLEEKYGNHYKKCLPFLFEDTQEQELGSQIRYDYMDSVSRLYKKNFSDAIGNWCAGHGVEYIGHVVEDNGIHSRLGMGAVHYFRAMSGQHMAGIDCIGGQVLYGGAHQGRLGMGESGGDGEFYHYALGKLGASCGHLDPKKKGRTLCELFGAYGWNFGVRDMKYVLDHLLVKGINYLVPHAFSMADYPDPDCPPHFYARGCNPQFPYFAELMKYADRMCSLLSNGTHIASVAVLYDGEADWIGGNMPMQKVCRELLENQIDFDIISIDMLNHMEDYNGIFADGKLVLNGVAMQALVIPYTRSIPDELAEFISHAENFPVFFIDGLPDQIIHASDNNKLEKITEKCEVTALDKLSSLLRSKNIYDIDLNGCFKELSFYHYKKSDGDVFVFQNESAAEKFCDMVKLPIQSEVLYYDAWNDCYEITECEALDEYVKVRIELEPAESCVLIEQKNKTCHKVHRSFCQQIAHTSKTMDISENWMVTKTSAKEYPHFPASKNETSLKPVSDKFAAFSGIIRYSKNIMFDKPPAEAYLKAEHVYESMKVIINGKEAGIRIAPPYQVPAGGYLQEGENSIIIEVATTPARDQLNYPHAPFDFQYDPMDATGMFGKITLHYQ